MNPIAWTLASMAGVDLGMIIWTVPQHDWLGIIILSIHGLICFCGAAMWRNK